MSPAPTTIRSTAGFRHLQIFELSASGSWLNLPLGAKTLTNCSPYVVSSGSYIAGSVVQSLTAGATVSGSVPYYGMLVSGAKVLTINDPAPRVIPHIGDDGVFGLQVLPPTEPVSGELHTDKTNDVVDAIVAAVKKFTIGQMNFMGQSTNKRGYENQVGLLAYSAAQDYDPDSTNFGQNLWDCRVLPKATLFVRDTGYGQEANERVYTVTPAYVTAHLWGVQFTDAVEGFTRAQILRGVSNNKPVICGWLGDGSKAAFSFDSLQAPASAAQITVWKNGILLPNSASFFADVYGLHFATAPLVTDILTAAMEVL